MTTPESTKTKSAKWTVLDSLLSYVRAMTTAPAATEEERAEWKALKTEFTKRAKDCEKVA